MREKNQRYYNVNGTVVQYFEQEEIRKLQCNLEKEK